MADEKLRRILPPMEAGQRYGKLVAIAPDPGRGRRNHWFFQCDCGKVHSTQAGHARDGRAKSCGCSRHKLSYTPTHNSWTMMKQRCQNPKNQDYGHYGGRGITVCERWQSFENFLADMGTCPKGMTIDRIDGTKGYEPGNCRWATRKQQSRNLSTTLIVTYQGRTAPLQEFCEELGISFNAVYYRMQIGLSVADALCPPRPPCEGCGGSMAGRRLHARACSTKCQGVIRRARTTQTRTES